MLLLFNFEKKYFDEENIKNTFVGHPLIENSQNNKTLIEIFGLAIFPANSTFLDFFSLISFIISPNFPMLIL